MRWKMRMRTTVMWRMRRRTKMRWRMRMRTTVMWRIRRRTKMRWRMRMRTMLMLRSDHCSVNIGEGVIVTGNYPEVNSVNM